LDESHQSQSNAIRISSTLEIPRGELEFRASRASGAGGQHVNKTSSRVELTWNVRRSAALSHEQRERIISRLHSRITDAGDLRVVASDTRSQFRNRQLAEQRLAERIRTALAPVKKRRPTKPTKAAKEKRLASKKKHSTKKQERRHPIDD
jgi:ribosome-associated protein